MVLIWATVLYPNVLCDAVSAIINHSPTPACLEEKLKKKEMKEKTSFPTPFAPQASNVEHQRLEKLSNDSIQLAKVATRDHHIRTPDVGFLYHRGTMGVFLRPFKPPVLLPQTACESSLTGLSISQPYVSKSKEKSQGE